MVQIVRVGIYMICSQIGKIFSMVCIELYAKTSLKIMKLKSIYLFVLCWLQYIALYDFVSIDRFKYHFKWCLNCLIIRIGFFEQSVTIKL